jgi:hypothetical protein
MLDRNWNDFETGDFKGAIEKVELKVALQFAIQNHRKSARKRFMDRASDVNVKRSVLAEAKEVWETVHVVGMFMREQDMVDVSDLRQ